MLAVHMHADLKVHSRRHVDPEVVRLQHCTRSQDRRVDLNQRVIVEQLVNVCLLLLAESKWEAGS